MCCTSPQACLFPLTKPSCNAAVKVGSTGGRWIHYSGSNTSKPYDVLPLRILAITAGNDNGFLREHTFMCKLQHIKVDQTLVSPNSI